MLSFNPNLPEEIFLLYIYRGHLGSQILSLDGYGRKEIGKRSFIGSSYPTLHHGCIKTKQCTISLRTDNSKSFCINSSLI